MTSTVLPISVVMPLWNDERHVAQALGSLVQGATSPAEIIVVDNGSTDNSVQTVEELGLPTLRLIRNTSNVGATLARNQALDLASQPFVSWLDSDDHLSPDALAQALRRTEETGSDIVLFRSVKTAPDGVTELFTLEPPAEPITGNEALALTLGSWRISATGVYRASTFAKARAQFEPFGFSDDELLSRYCLATARSVVGCNGTYYYRTVSKPYDFSKVVGQTITNIGATALAAERLGPGHPGTRAMRDVVVRNLAGLKLRALRGEGPSSDIRRLSGELRDLAIPFGTGNGKARLITLALRLLP